MRLESPPKRGKGDCESGAEEAAGSEYEYDDYYDQGMFDSDEEGRELEEETY